MELKLLENGFSHLHVSGLFCSFNTYIVLC